MEQDGTLFSLENRPLVAFQQAGVQVPFRMATADDIAYETDALPFLETPLGQLMGTWILAGLILVFVTDFTRGSIDEIPIAIKT